MSREEWTELKKFKSEFIADFRSDSDWRKQKRQASNFYDGEQWDAEDKRVLEERGQPVVTINRIKPKMDSICGMQQAIRVDTKAFPHGLRNKEAEVQDISERFRSYEHANEFDSEESKVFKDGLIDGRGWYEHEKIFEEGVNKRCTVKRSCNADWVPHRFGKADGYDDKQLHNTAWYYLDDAKALFPGHDDELDAAARAREAYDPLFSDEHERVKPDQYSSGVSDGSTFGEADLALFVDDRSKRVRIVKTYYREKVMEKRYAHANLEEPIAFASDEELRKLQESFPNGNVLTKLRTVISSYAFTWNAPLEHKRDIRSYDREGKFPATKYTAYTSRESGVDYGLVKQHIDSQMEYNKRRSKLLHLLNVTRLIHEEGAFPDPAEAHRQVARPDTRLEYRKGFQVDIKDNVEIAQSQFQLLQLTGKEIDASGVNQELEGRSTASSGREYQMRQQQAMQSIRELFDNLATARRRVFEYYLDEIINDNPELAVTKYDVVVEEAPDTVNLQQETFATLASLAKSGMPIPPEMIIEVSPLTEDKKNEFLQKMQAQQQAQMQAVMAQQQAAQGGMPAA